MAPYAALLVLIVTFKDAIWACYRRSLEMGDKDSNVGPGRVHQPEIVVVPKGEVDKDA